jgi:hypothetical protein
MSGVLIMPYIKEEQRIVLDRAIGMMVEAIKSNINKAWQEKITDEDFLNILGDINYTTSRIVSQLMGDVSYGKIAMATGVLENIKQELYRRIAAKYEDSKILANGDIPEYKKL